MERKEAPQERLESESDPRSFNALSPKVWTSLSKSVWNDVSSTRRGFHLKHGATFPEKLADRVIALYSTRGDTVLDPFLGTGTTLVAATKAGRAGIGIELNPEFVGVSREQVHLAAPESLWGSSAPAEARIYCGDCSELLATVVPPLSVQLTFTSPPYADLLHKVAVDRALHHRNSRIVLSNNSVSRPYSDNCRDLGNMDLEVYTVAIGTIMRQLYDATLPGGYNVWVVKDYRDTQHGQPYVDLHTRIANAGVMAGFKYHDLIIWDQNAQRSLVVLGYPSVFYTNQNHAFLVVLRKPL